MKVLDGGWRWMMVDDGLRFNNKYPKHTHGQHYPSFFNIVMVVMVYDGSDSNDGMVILPLFLV